MKILAIETSCDDTCIAIAEKTDNHIGFLSSVISSQIEVHKKWGGVYPTLAKREHEKNLVTVLKEALEEAKLLKKGFSKKSIESFLEREDVLKKSLKEFLSEYEEPEIDAIAVTMGPGLDPSLWTGINFAKALSYCFGVPLIPINHIKAHFFAPLLLEKPLFPVISLLVSGGHTELILSNSLENHQVIGKTRDDAAGEAFDKIARLLELGYPGGPAIEKIAKSGKDIAPLPRPMKHSNDFDFSFSGLKTAVLYRLKKEQTQKESMAKEAQEAIVDVLISKTKKAAQKHEAKTVLIGGGVSANKRLREEIKKMAEELKINYIIPSFDLCTDNAKMIAITAFFEYEKGVTIKREELRSNPNLKL